MSRLIAAHILPQKTLANEVQVELTWETLDIKKGDFATVLNHWKTAAPTRRHTEIRPYANAEIASAAIKNLAPHLDLA